MKEIFEIRDKVSKGEMDTNEAFWKVLDLLAVNGRDFHNRVDIMKRYSSVIADIYASYHVNPFTDIQKHNEGIIKAIVEFAIFYKEHST